MLFDKDPSGLYKLAASEETGLASAFKEEVRQGSVEIAERLYFYGETSTWAKENSLKKLFELKMVTFEEVVEKGVNKKRYAITDIGQKKLIEWIKIPIDTSKTKNVDFGKLLFMGYVSRNDQKNLIDKIIRSLLLSPASPAHASKPESTPRRQPFRPDISNNTDKQLQKQPARFTQ